MWHIRFNMVAKYTRKGQIEPRFKQTYDHLADIRNQLERLSLTQAWSLRETDLHSFSRQLDKVDDSRSHGNFEDAEGEPADLHTQRVRSICRFHPCANLRHCYTSFGEATPIFISLLSVPSLSRKP